MKKQNKILLKENENLRREIERRQREQQDTEIPNPPPDSKSRIKRPKTGKNQVQIVETEKKSLEEEIVEEYEKQIMDVKKTLVKERKEKKELIERLKVSKN